MSTPLRAESYEYTTIVRADGAEAVPIRCTLTRDGQGWRATAHRLDAINGLVALAVTRETGLLDAIAALIDPLLTADPLRLPFGQGSEAGAAPPSASPGPSPQATVLVRTATALLPVLGVLTG